MHHQFNIQQLYDLSTLYSFLSPEIATSINIHVPASLSRIIMTGLLLGMVLSVCTCWFHNMVTLPPWLVSTDFGTCSYQCFLSSCTPVSLHMLKCSWAHTLSCLFVYCVLLLLLLLLLLIITLYSAFTIIYLKHTIFLGCITAVLWLPFVLHVTILSQVNPLHIPQCVCSAQYCCFP